MWTLGWAQAGGESSSSPLDFAEPLTLLQGRWEAMVAYLPRIAVALVVVIVTLWISRRVGKLERPYRKLLINPLARNLLQQTVRVIVLGAGLLLALDVLQATALVGAVLGTAGVVGLAIGFAFKDIVENYIAGVLLSLRQPFAPLDFVDVAGHAGKVIRLTSRATILMTADGNHLRLPNSLVFKSVITNYTRAPRRRFDFSVGVGVGAELAGVLDLGLEVLRTMDGVLDDPAPAAEIVELAGSHVTVRFYGWVDQATHSLLKVKSEALRRVKVAFDQARIELPEPTYRVRMTPESSLVESAELEVARSSASGRAPAKDGARAGVDLTVDNTLDRQIESEMAADSPVDLLNSEAPQE